MTFSGLPPYVLLVDDDKDDLELLSSSLEEMGVATKTCTSGPKALYYLQLLSDTGALPVLMIMDYNMPGMDGWTCLDRLKANRDTSGIPVVMYSTTITGVLRARLVQSGALDCQVKPSSYTEFVKQVQGFRDLARSLSPGKGLVC